ncbi:transcriptional regulator [Pseudomonas aeruginosa]|nr:transcriptional regulator [Pseudomonas aeruginosa]
MVPGRYADRVLHMKYISTGASALQPQLAIAEFIGNGHYEPHLRRMRAQYQRGRDLMIDWVARYFPEGTRASRPQGGFLLWVELDEAFDTLRLDKALRNRGVQVAVGCIFSASGKYRNCLRMNYAALPTPAIEQAGQASRGERLRAAGALRGLSGSRAFDAVDDCTNSKC